MTTTDNQSTIKGLTAIAGGIGSGKSVVAAIVAAMGYEVYDCDIRARLLMEQPAIKADLALEFGNGIFDADGNLIRPALASIVFADPEKLRRLNAITHSAVREDLARWASQRCGAGRRCFVETAILYQSGLDRMVESVWEVTAPTELRIERVGVRNGLTREQIMSRIDAQDSFMPEKIHHRISVIVNDGITPLLPAIEHLLDYDR